MHDDCCCGPVHPEAEDVRPSGLTRRHLLLAGAAVGGVVALRGVPALGQEQGSASSDPGATSTTTTTTAPATTPPAITEPAHPTGPQTFESGGFSYESPNRGIMFPVFPATATTWNREQDTYGAPRSHGRHQGEDLMGRNGAKGVKLLAAKSGTVYELRHRAQPSGNSLYIKGDDGWFYCYLHINNDRPGTDDASNLVANAWGPGLRQFATGASTMDEAAAKGYRVREGEVVAYMGDSGNAEGSGSHLHFEIRTATSTPWNGASVNPRESLRNAKPPREASMVPPETFRPWDNSAAFITAQYKDFLGRTPSSADVSYYGEMLDNGTKTPDWLMQYFLESREGDSMTQAIGRLYQAFYRRLPDTEGFTYWLDARRSGSWGVYRIAEQFARAPEFTRLYGNLGNAAYVDLVYENVLGRAPDADGKAYWVGQLEAGVTRGRVMAGFSESGEYKTANKSRMHVVGCYGVMLNRVPSGSELSTWAGHLNGGGSSRDMITMLRQTDEYRAAANS